MKSFYLVAAFWLFSINLFPQATYYPLVNGSGEGESTITDFNYSHHTNYMMRIINLTVKWKLFTLFGEPVVDGVFKWKAASDTPNDYLDYRDYVLLECYSEKNFLNGARIIYLKLNPTVPKSGEGYGFNSPGSPSWENVFYTREGKPAIQDIPGFNAATAKAIWKGGFRITGVVLLREGGKDGFLKPQSTNSDDFWNTPENTTTTQQQTQEIKQKEAVKRQKALNEQAKAKYNALKNPYSWNVTKNDTVFDAETQIIKNLNPYFNNGTITLSSVNKGKVIGTSNNITTNLPLAEGWNTLRIALKGTNYNLKDSVKVYYKKSTRKVLLFDDFNDVTLDKNKWPLKEEYLPIVKDGSLIIKNRYFSTNNLKLLPNKNLVLELKYQYRTEWEKWEILSGPQESRYLNASVRFGGDYVSYDSCKEKDINNEITLETSKSRGDNALRLNLYEDTWIEQKFIYKMSEGKIDIYINKEFIGELNYDYTITDLMKITFQLGNLTYSSQFKIDYINIYQE